MDKKVIFVCAENHHWLNNKTCPYCGKMPIKEVVFQDGDCIKCGNLCPGYAYGCTTPEPLFLNK